MQTQGKLVKKCRKRGNSKKGKLTESKRVGGRYWRGCSGKKRSEERREEELASSYAQEKDGDAWDAIYILEAHSHMYAKVRASVSLGAR